MEYDPPVGVATIFVANGHPIYRAGLRSLLRKNFSFGNIIDCRDASELRAAAMVASSFALAAVSLDLPGLNGMDGLKSLREDHSKLRLLVLLDDTSRETILAALSAGAHGVVTTSASDEELRSAIGALVSGQIYVPAELADLQPANPDSAIREASELTQRQLAVLEQVACGKSNKQIARALDIAESTVKVHLNAAYHLLGVHNRVSATVAFHNLAEHWGESEPQLPGIADSGR